MAGMGLVGAAGGVDMGATAATGKVATIVMATMRVGRNAAAAGADGTTDVKEDVA
jgi:hypothetical protein